MPCSTEEALARLFYNTSSSVHLLLLFLYVSFIVLAKFFYFIGSNPIFPRNWNGYENYMFSDEEEEEEEERHSFHVHGHQYYTENDHLVADIIHGGEALKFLPDENLQRDRSSFSDQEFISAGESLIEEDRDDISQGSEYDHSAKEIPVRDPAPVHNSVSNDRVWTTSPITIGLHRSYSRRNDKRCDDNREDSDHITGNSTVTDENFIVFRPPQLETRKLIRVQENKDDEIFGDSTVGSTSKSSSDWRSSINCSATEDPFSSSSRRSCPKWESYAVFQKYDEEMMYLDRISAQKLHETESLRSIQVCPRSISERIVHQISLATKRPSDVRHNPYHELEAAYVAQICLTWEALNWNYKKFEQKRASSSRHDFDPGCPGKIAQQFQQFQVLLQRYVENEPYEQGRRPEIYARMRLLAPKLLQVPEYREDDDHEKEEGFGSRISSAAFLMIMEDGIRTFMEFLKADKEKPCQKLSAMFRRKRRGSVDPTLLNLMKKVNQKKKMKIKDLRRSHKCLRKKSLKVEEEMEILLGLIDLKLISRVLRMSDLSANQLHWCEEKMSKVRVLDGKYQRDSTPLFFPAQGSDPPPPHVFAE
ncbi:uncharacterized protein LOC126793448 isoform X2 [Argentina anserina]|uniref:uncharacterized protein LOC126793448 isoform X2 n=1 Tax=Argentina anserina TaxID=57926 RepID=UPI002176906A|nr:uncharacterized protein LOC126793448 isoform X2 [Potentilla anserina]